MKANSARSVSALNRVYLNRNLRITVRPQLESPFTLTSPNDEAEVGLAAGEAVFIPPEKPPNSLLGLFRNMNTNKVPALEDAVALVNRELEAGAAHRITKPEVAEV